MIHRFVGILTAVLLCSIPVSAQLHEHSFELLFMGYHLGYTEELPPPLVSQETGWLPGVAAAYTYGGSNNPIYLNVTGEYTNMSTDYNGGFQLANGGFFPFQNQTSNIFARVEGTFGFTILRSYGRLPADLIVYGGYGYRTWKRDLGSAYGIPGYEENYSWNYVPIGVRSDVGWMPGFSAGLDISARVMVGGSIAIFDHAFNNPTLDLGNQVGWKIALPCQYELTGHLALLASPWYEHSSIGQSNSSAPALIGNLYYTLSEPPSGTNQVGLNVGLRLGF